MLSNEPTPVPSNPTLENGEVHIWMATVATATNCAAVLSNAERLRASRFRFERDRVRWIGAHVLQRVALASYLQWPPEGLHIDSGPRDKPQLLGSAGAEGLEFNLSHAGDLALVAVANRCAVGVDLEVVGADQDLVAIARRVLGDDLAEELSALPKREQRSRFYQAWVRHEAHTKCLGSGLVEPSDASLDPVTMIDLDLGDAYAGALAVERPPLRIRRWLASL